MYVCMCVCECYNAKKKFAATAAKNAQQLQQKITPNHV